MRGVDTLLPPRCPVTGDIVDRQGMVSPAAWQALDFIAEPFCQQCGVSFEYEDDGGERHCVPCLSNPPAYDRARAALSYNAASRDLILGFKHGDKTHVVQSFVPWLTRAGRDILPETDYVIPVPLHPLRLFMRRYNQAALIGHALSREIGCQHLPMALRRVRATPSQGHLNRQDRTQNVKRAFVVSRPYQAQLVGKVVTLVDDVFTTGATAEECARTLKKQAGVARVNILTVARVMRPD